MGRLSVATRWRATWAPAARLLAAWPRTARWLAYAAALAAAWVELGWGWRVLIVKWASPWLPSGGAGLAYWLVEWKDLFAGPILAFTVLVGLVASARFLMRASLRWSGGDTAAVVRGWLERHRRGLIAASLIAPVAWVVDALREDSWRFEGYGLRNLSTAYVVGYAVCAGIVIALSSVAMLALARTLGAPLLAPASKSGNATDTEDRLYFEAVAVTPEAQRAVLLVAAVSVIAALSLVAVPIEVVFDARTQLATALYTLALVAGAWLYRRASRVAVGLDGVLITGTSRTRFFDYQEMDTAETSRAGEVTISHGGRVVLRLQPHSEDALLREAIAARIRAHIERARSLVGTQAQRLAQAASATEMDRAARGLGDYRAASMGIDELWQIIEAPVAAAEQRRAAARALGRTLDQAGRTRLRVAAERCAEPDARRTLLRVASGEVEDDEAVADVEASVEARRGRTRSPSTSDR